MSAPSSITRIHQQKLVALRLVTDPRGKTEYPASAKLNVPIGRSVYMSCSRGGHQHRGLGVHGDIDIIPPWTASVWEPDNVDTALVMSVDAKLLEGVAGDLGALGKVPAVANGGFARRQLKTILAFIEDNLDKDLGLAEIAAVARISPSRCKIIFRTIMSLPLHQYVIQRRVERARVLLSQTELAISEVALQAGFAHQSHLARHMRRILGYTPKSLKHEMQQRD